MRKMFTRLFGLTLLMYLVSSLTVVKAQCTLDLDQLTEDNVVLLTDISTVCDGGNVQYEVIGYESDSTYYSFNGEGDESPAGFGLANTFTTVEGRPFVVQVRVGSSCFTNVLPYTPVDSVVAMTLDTILVTQPRCTGDDGELTVVVGGTEDFVVYYVDSATVSPAWDPNYTEYTPHTETQFLGIPGHKYYMGISSVNCSTVMWDSVYVKEAPTPVVVDSIYVAATDSIDCIGGTGVVTVEVGGGGTPYSSGEYMVELVETGAKVMTIDSVATFNVPAGVYTAIAIDSFECKSAVTDSSAVLVDPEEITFDISLDDIACADSTDGAIYVHDFTGPADSVYLAFFGADTVLAKGVPVDDTIAFEGLEVGYYSVWVSNADGCDSVPYDNGNNTGNVISLQAPTGIELTVSVDTLECYGETSTISASATGGSGNFEYQLEEQTDDVVSAWSATSTWAVGAGTYYVLVRDADVASCEIMADSPIELVDPAGVEILSLDSISPTCPGGTDGAIMVTATTEPGRTLEYSINGTTWYNNNLLTVAPGDYTVYVRDNVCPDSVAMGMVTVVPVDTNVIELVYDLGQWPATDTVNECSGVSSNAIVVGVDTWAKQNGESRELTVVITDDESSVYVSGDTLTQGFLGNWRATNVAPGTYYIWAIDNYGCVFDADLDGTPDYLTVTVTENDPLVVSGTVTENATCYGSYDGVMTITTSDSVEYIGRANTLQAAMNLQLNAMNYYPDGTDSVSMQVGKGTYYLVAYNPYCDERAYAGPFTVDGLDMVTIRDTAMSVTDIVCAGDLTGVIEVFPAEGGTEAFSYTLQVWEEGAWVDVDDYTDVDYTMYTGLARGTYQVVVTDLGGCTGTATANINIDGPTEEVVISSYNYYHISCNSSADGVIEIWAAGGTAPYQFKVGPNNWRDFPTASNHKEIAVIEAGEYEVWVRDAMGCTSESQIFVIEEPEAIDFDVVVTDVTDACDAENGALEIDNVTGGSTSDYTVYVNGVNEADHWDAEDFPLDLTGLVAGEYVVKVVSNHGNGLVDTCFTERTFNIYAPDTVSAKAEVTQQVSCNGGDNGQIVISDMAGGTVANGYLVTISPVAGTMSETETTVVFDGLKAGTYSVTVTDDENCSYTINGIEVEEPTALTLDATHIKDISCTEDGEFSVQVTGGTGEYVYYAAKSDPNTGHVLITDIPTVADTTWQSDSIFVVDEPGTWIVWAMDDNGCIIGGEEDEEGPVNEWRVQIEEPEFLVDFVAAQTEIVKCNGGDDAVIEVSSITINGVAATLDDVIITINDVVTSDSITGLVAGTYVIEVEDKLSGCSTKETVTVDEPDELMVTKFEPGEGEFSCPDVNEGYIEVTAEGGTGVYTYELWKDGSKLNDYTQNSFLVQIGSYYQVVVVDENGCTDTTEVLPIDPVDPVVIVEGSIMDVSCADDALASLKLTVTGEEDRMFQVQYRLYEETTVYDTTEWYSAGDIYMYELLEFDNENIDDKHYEIYVVDNKGCMSDLDTVTIDSRPGSSISLTPTVGEVSGCGTEVTLSAAGGVEPYTYKVDGMDVDGPTVVIGGGTHIVVAMDSHECIDVDTITLAYPMTMDTTVYAYVGDTVDFVYEAADLDTALLASEVVGVTTYTFYYDVDEACTAELVVNVDAREKSAPVLDTVSPMGDIETNHPTFTITFADDVTFNESGVLTVTEKDSANATLTLTITPEMVSGNTVTVTYDHTVSGGLNQHTTYVVAVDSGVVMGDGLVWDGNVPYAWEFTTGDFATGITPDVETVEFKVYPNPFNSFIRIDNSEKLDRVIISNIAGQRIMDIENPTYEIRTGNLVTGVYVVTLISNDEIVKSERIIKR